MPNSSTQTQTICIVLTSESGRGAGDLCRALTERQWLPVIVNDPLSAMAEAAIRMRERTARSAEGQLPGEQVVMAICEHWMREHSRDRDRLLQAICRYLPEIGLWAYEGEKLIPIREGRAIGADATISHCGAAGGDEEFESEEQAPVDVVITRREMDMLLQSATGGES